MISGAARGPGSPAALAIWGVVAALALSPPAWAARPAVVEIQDAPVYEGPGEGFKLLEKLSRGTSLAVSNVPTEGYYKVRASNGLVGWISGNAIVLMGPGTAGAVDDPAAPGAATPASSPDSKAQGSSSVAGFRKKRAHEIVRLRLLGALSLFNASDLNSYLGFNALAAGYGFGGEVGIAFTKDFAAIIRVERVMKTTIARDVNSVESIFQLDYGATPLMAGFEMRVLQDKKYWVDAALFGGVAVGFKLVSKALTKTEPASTEWTATPWTVMARISGGYQVTGPFSVFAELGYRILKTAAITPSAVGNGSEIYKKDGEFPGVVLDMNGPVVSAGAMFAF